MAEDRHIRRGEILLAGPGRNNTIKLALSRDLKRARQVAIICACFLPPGRILRQMARLARRRLKVQLILPGKSDVFLSHLAALRKAFITALCGLASRRIGPKIGWRAGFWRIWTLTAPINFLTWDKS